MNHDIYLSLILSRYAATPQGETVELYHTGYGLTTSGQVWYEPNQTTVKRRSSTQISRGNGKGANHAPPNTRYDIAPLRYLKEPLQ